MNKVKLIILLILAFVLTIVWFHKGLVLGGGEAGVPFYNFQNELSIHSNAWVAKALGNPTGIVTALSPFFFLLSLLQKIGVAPVIIQAGLFFILLATGSIGMYLLVRKFSDNSTSAFFSALFYNLNLLAMTIVWNRFQYPFMFFYACMPFALFLFIKGLKEKKVIYAFILNFFLLFFVMVFTSLPLLLLFWIVLVCYLLFFISTSLTNKKQIFWSVFYFLVCLIIFIIFNLWWIIQFIQTFFASTYLLTEAYATSDNYITFSALSNNLGNLQYLARLMHRDFFLWMKDVWGTIYFNPFFVLLSFLPLLFVFGSMVIKNKPKEYYFYLFLAIFALFFAKGSNDPFGGIFYFLFTHIKLLEAFRNPFEKIGLILPLAYAPLFGFGLYHFYSYLKKKKKWYAKSVVIFLLFSICGLLVWPMWNGWVFTSNEPPTNNTSIGDYIKIPSYYKNANDWLNQLQQDFRTIALPLKGEGLTHTWEYGYNGVDLSSSLFDKPFLAFCTGLEYLCSITKKFQPQLTRHPEDFWKILPPLNVKYVMVREDIDYRLRSLQDPKDIYRLLDRDTQHFSLDKQFEKLSFYKLSEGFSQPKIDGTSSAIYYSNPINESFIEASSYADYQKGDIYIIDVDKKLDFHENLTKQILLKAYLFTPSELSVSKENAEAALPYIRFLPDSRFYFYSRIKEKVTRFLAGNNYSREIVIESDKRIVEVKRLVEKKNFILAEKTLKEYQSYLQLFLKNPSFMAEKLNQIDLLRQKYLLVDTLMLAKNNKYDTSLFEETSGMLNELLYNLNIETKYPVDLTKYSSYKTFIPEEGDYELVFETNDWYKFYSSPEIELIIDGKEKRIIPIDALSDTLRIKILLTKGGHQIDILNPQPINLIKVNEDIQTFDTEQIVKNYNFPFTYFDPFGEYLVRFDYVINKGNMPIAFVTHDTDIFKKGKLQAFSSFSIDADFYDRDWRNFTVRLENDPIAHASKLVFKATPWNDCEARNTGLLKARCDNQNFKAVYNKRTQIKIKNIVVTRQLNNNLFLRKERSLGTRLSKPKVTYTKINSATYLVDVKDASTPFFLTFLESFHPSWKAFYVDSTGKKKEIEIKNHLFVNSFANAWYIEKIGNYQVLLEFYPQQLLSMGSIFSFIIIFGSLFVVIILQIKKKYGK